MQELKEKDVCCGFGGLFSLKYPEISVRMADDKLTTRTNITSVLHTLLDGLHSMSKSETIIGDPYTLGDATLATLDDAARAHRRDKPSSAKSAGAHKPRRKRRVRLKIARA